MSEESRRVVSSQSSASSTYHSSKQQHHSSSTTSSGSHGVRQHELLREPFHMLDQMAPNLSESGRRGVDMLRENLWGPIMPFDAHRIGFPAMGAPGGDFGEVQETETLWSLRVPVEGFKPEELSVRTVGHQVTISGQSGLNQASRDESSHDVAGGRESAQWSSNSSSKQFTCSYTLPSNVEVEEVKSVLAKDGFLMVQAPKKPLLTNG